MKRLCVFYDTPKRRTASEWLGRNIEWIVCKRCQKILRSGKHIYTSLGKLVSRYAEV